MKLLDAFWGSKALREVYRTKRNWNRRERNLSDVENLSYGRVPVEETIKTNKTEENGDKNIKEVLEKETVSVETEELVLEHIYEIKSKIEELSVSVNASRETVEEKIHSENVKAYRNYQAVLEEVERKMAKSDQLEKHINSLRIYMKCATWFSITTFLVLIAYILYGLGVF